MGKFSLLVELHQEGSAPAACAEGLFLTCELLYCGSLAMDNQPVAKYHRDTPAQCLRSWSSLSVEYRSV